MKLLQDKRFNILLVVIFAFSLISIYFYGCQFGIRNEDISLTIINALLMLMATMIAISFPLYSSRIAEEEHKREELKMAYVAVALYVGNEILDNVIEIEDILAENRKIESKLNGKDTTISEKSKKMTMASIWKTAAEDLILSLEDKHHTSMVISGLVAKIRDDQVNSDIRETYQKMDNLKKRLRRMSIFLDMLLTPPPDISLPFLNYQLEVKLDAAIKAVLLDVKIFNQQAKKTQVGINKLLKPYGKQIGIVHFGEQVKK